MMSRPAKTQVKPPRSKVFSSASFDPNKAMQEMMGIIDTLRGIYTTETDALKVADTDTFLKLQNIKLETAREYQQGVEFMLKNKTEMKDVHPSLKTRLAAMQEEFADLGQKNMEALQRMQRCTQRLGDTIMGAAREEAKKQRVFNYAETGIIAASERKGVSISLNETA